MNAQRSLGRRRTAPRQPPLTVARGSWVSLFAMLMIFIGPLISQSMPMGQRAPMSMSMSMSMDMSMDMAPGAHAGHEAQAPAEHCAPQADHHAIWEKCGYCSLLFNCPALPGSQALAIFNPPLAQGFISPLPRLGHARLTVFPGARTRAPPINA